MKLSSKHEKADSTATGQDNSAAAAETKNITAKKRRESSDVSKSGHQPPSSVTQDEAGEDEIAQMDTNLRRQKKRERVVAQHNESQKELDETRVVKQHTSSDAARTSSDGTDTATGREHKIDSS